ncbi:MAG: DUF554 domain-containing protein [Solobacterium sp.]|nr:DUF554 domain-containing protein [Solobacterium sp.]
MPIGVIINVLSVALGGIFGSVVKDKLSDSYKTNMNMLFGLASMGMGISSIVLMKNMPAVIFSLIIGTTIGLVIHLGDAINKAAGAMQALTGGGKKENAAQLVTIIVLFCASGTGIYGALVSGMNGDHSILIAKSILDFCTAMIFACTLGKTVSMIAIPQGIIMLALFLLAGFIYPMTTPDMINDFKACGGFIMLATGFRIIQVKNYPTADMIPAMILVMPLSWFWMTYIIPLVG